jgi:hypothetical protein
LTLDDETFASIVQRVRDEKKLELAAFQPRFIVDQVVASCRFIGRAVSLEPRFIQYAIDNLRTRRSSVAAQPFQTAGD